MSIELKNSYPITDNYLMELGAEHPFGRICCQVRKMQPTVCDGTCRGCEQAMNKFRETEPIRIKTIDTIQNGGDVAYEFIDIDTYRKNLENRIRRWQKQKGTIVELMKHTDERMRVLQLQATSPEMACTLQ